MERGGPRRRKKMERGDPCDTHKLLSFALIDWNLVNLLFVVCGITTYLDLSFKYKVWFEPFVV